MSKPIYVSANLVPTYDTFAGWLTMTNQIIYDMGVYVVTTSNTASPGITVGNSFVNGHFGANNLYAVTSLQGGTANTAANLVINSGVSISNSIWTSGAATIGGYANITGNTTIGGTANVTGNVSIGGTANITGNVTTSGSANVGGNLNVAANISSNNVTINNNLYVGNTATINIGLFNASTIVSGGFVSNSTVMVFGNSTVNASISSNSTVTFFSGMSNNALYLGGVPAANYVSTSGAYTINGVLTLTANISMSNNYIKQATFAGYSESVYTNTAVTGTVSLDCSLYNFFALTLTGNITISPTNVPAGKAVALTIIAKQDTTGGRTITWPSTKWPAGVIPPPTTGASNTDIWVITTYDGGTTYYGSLAGKALA